jgi:hypothetical protein
MGIVYSVRIPRKLKEEMDKLKDVVDWRKEIIAFIEERIEVYRRQKVLQEIAEALKELPKTPRGTAARLVREDRDSY